jgi:GNAT superfamily N-acetyltransferase
MCGMVRPSIECRTSLTQHVLAADHAWIAMPSHDVIGWPLTWIYAAGYWGGDLLMGDMLVRLYKLDDDWSCIRQQRELGITIRKPIGPERHVLIDWVRSHWHSPWVGEVDVALSNTPMSCFVAVRSNEFIGFACYDATALGLFGPLGVLEEHRGRGTGRALLMACMLDMKLKGYGYAIIGWAGSDVGGFYEGCVGATPISDTGASVWDTWVQGDSPLWTEND